MHGIEGKKKAKAPRRMIRFHGSTLPKSKAETSRGGFDRNLLNSSSFIARRHGTQLSFSFEWVRIVTDPSLPPSVQWYLTCSTVVPIFPRWYLTFSAWYLTLRRYQAGTSLSTRLPAVPGNRTPPARPAITTLLSSTPPPPVPSPSAASSPLPPFCPRPHGPPPPAPPELRRALTSTYAQRRQSSPSLPLPPVAAAGSLRLGPGVHPVVPHLLAVSLPTVWTPAAALIPAAPFHLFRGLQ
ncbi:hypothetical protein K438DRAFT_1980598 [Mycena galopus ATCC 62051]|nr:hypothetical protein K438DRAFT_1980598 [Mycena galopus ATCC 62051]